MENGIEKKDNDFLAERETAVYNQEISVSRSQPSNDFAMTVDDRARSAASTLRKAAEAVLAMDAAKDALAKDVRYIVDMSDAAKRAIELGMLKFDVDNQGRLFAQVRRANGEFGGKFPIKKEIIAHGIDPVEVRTAMQTQAIQQQLEQIAETLQEIGEEVSEVKRGQHADRLGLCRSGRALFLESREVSDKTLRSLLESQALKSLSDGVGQMMQEISSDVKYLTEGKYKSRKGGQRAAIAERLSSIRGSLDAVNVALSTKASIYYGEGEVRAMLRTLEGYAEFMSNSIAPWAGSLAELDSTDMLPRGGFWEDKARALQAVEQIRNVLEGREDANAEALPEPDEEKGNDEEGQEVERVPEPRLPEPRQEN